MSSVVELVPGLPERVQRLAHARAHERAHVWVVQLAANHADADAADGLDRAGPALKHGQKLGGPGDGARQRPNAVAGVREREEPRARHRSRRRFHADDAAVGGRDADGAAAVGADRLGADAGPNERCGAARRAAGGPAGVVRIERHAVGRVDAARAVLQQIRLAEDVRARGAHPGDSLGVRRGRRWYRHRRGVGGHLAGDVDVVLDRDRTAVQRAGRGPLGRLHHGDHCVQGPAEPLEPLVGGQQVEIRPLAHPAAVLDRVDERARVPHERPVERREHRVHLGLAVPHGEVAVDAPMRLGRTPVELDQPVDRSLEIGGVEAVERLGRGGRRRQHLARERHEERPVAGLGERVCDRQV